MVILCRESLLTLGQPFDCESQEDLNDGPLRPHYIIGSVCGVIDRADPHSFTLHCFE